MEEQILLAQLQNNDNLIKDIYTKHKSYCINFLKNRAKNSNSLIHEVLLDIYHDAVIVLYEKSLNPDFKLTCSIQTYLVSICYNKLRLKIRELSRTKSLPEGVIEISDELDEIDKEGKFVLMEEAIKKMKETSPHCYQIFKRFYYLKQNMVQIASEMNYNNADTAKQQKAKCKKKLVAFVNA